MFGESFLRLEDYYCYMATLLKTLGDVYSPSQTDAYNNQYNTMNPIDKENDPLSVFDPVQLDFKNLLHHYDE